MTLASPTFSATFSATGLSCVRGERGVFGGLSFDVSSGQVLYLTGANGSGKSSLLRVLAGLIRPADGTLTWNGTPISDTRDTHRERVRYVGHHDAVKPVLTVAENLSFWINLSVSEIEAENDPVMNALDHFGLKTLADMPARFLSAGQKRRLNLSRLIAAPAPLWLLDEPTTAVDRAGIEALDHALARHLGNGGMAIIATHDPLTADVVNLDVSDFPFAADMDTV